MNQKEQFRIAAIEKLTRIENRSGNFREFLANLDMFIPEDQFEVSFSPKLQATSYMIEYHNCLLKIDSYNENIIIIVTMLKKVKIYNY